MSDPNIRRASLAEIKRMREAGELHRDPDAPVGESLGRDFWAKAMPSLPRDPPRSVHLKLEPEVFEFFKAQGKGHLTKMQDVLKAYANAHRRCATAPARKFESIFGKHDAVTRRVRADR